MSMSDPIADMLTRIRNAMLREHKQVIIPSSKIKKNIAKILQSESFIEGYKEENSDKLGKQLFVYLKYDGKGKPIIRNIQRVSKPGFRIFKGYKFLKPLKNGQGIYVLSTSQGVLSDFQCRKYKIGGEILCAVY